MSIHHQRHTHAPVSDRDRRASLRVEVLERIQGELRALELTVELLNLSYGGFLIQASLELVLGGTHEFRFTTQTGTSVILLARVIHISETKAGGIRMYVIGLEFEDKDDPAITAAIALLVEQLYE